MLTQHVPHSHKLKQMPALMPVESLKWEEDPVGTSSLWGVNPTVVRGGLVIQEGRWLCAHSCSPLCGLQANKSLFVVLAGSKNITLGQICIKMMKKIAQGKKKSNKIIWDSSRGN